MVEATRSQYGGRALDWFFSRPIFAASDFVVQADIPEATAKRILRLFREERPLQFFGYLFGALSVLSLLISIPVVLTYLETGLVPRFVPAVLATGTMLLAFLSLVCGLILDTVTRGRRELRRLSYLAIPATGRPPASKQQG